MRLKVVQHGGMGNGVGLSQRRDAKNFRRNFFFAGGFPVARVAVGSLGFSNIFLP